MLSKSCENQTHVPHMVLSDSTEYGYIVDINHDEVIQILSENIIHHRLEGTGGVFKSKWHYKKLERTIFRSSTIEGFDLEAFLRVSEFQFTRGSALYRELFQFLDEIKAAKWLLQIIRN